MNVRHPHDIAVSMLLSPLVLLRASLCVALLVGIGVLAYHVTAANLDARLAEVAAAAVPLALVAWAAWSPASSEFRMWIVEAVLVATRVVIAFAVVFSLVGLWRVGFAAGPWLHTSWQSILIVPAALLFERAIAYRVQWSANASAVRQAPAA